MKWPVRLFERLPCLHGNLDACHGRNAGGEERTNEQTLHAVAIYRDTEIVGHIPYNLAPRMSALLMRENKAFAKITGAKVNRGAGYGLEVRCLLSIWTKHLC